MEFDYEVIHFAVTVAQKKPLSQVVFVTNEQPAVERIRRYSNQLFKSLPIGHQFNGCIFNANIITPSQKDPRHY